jgi:hypothetical protein
MQVRGLGAEAPNRRLLIDVGKEVRGTQWADPPDQIMGDTDAANDCRDGTRHAVEAFNSAC